jgi:NAD/NADP transhydrogenase alpha subunit
MAASRSIDISVESVEETSIQTLRATLGVLRELREGESRVALVPADIKRLSGLMYTSNRGAGGYAAEQTRDQQSASRRALMRLMHTPLMAATNAVSGISLVASHVLGG